MPLSITKPRDPGQILSHGQPIVVPVWRCAHKGYAMLLASESAQCGARAGDWAMSRSIPKLNSIDDDARSNEVVIYIYVAD
jgi:hypothetical protein